MKKSDRQQIEELYSAILLIQGPEEARKFFRDLMTEKELMEMGNRWKAAKMLAKKERYIDIERETGLSSRTIARVAKWLDRGKGGYQSLTKKINKINHHNSFPPGKELS